MDTDFTRSPFFDLAAVWASFDQLDEDARQRELDHIRSVLGALTDPRERARVQETLDALIRVQG